MPNSAADLLASELPALGLRSDVAAPLLEYLNLLKKWMKPFNLTAVKTERDMVIKHLFDSLSIVKFMDHSQRVCDVGTGAGLPGIPLALCLPDTDFVLLDSNGKKTRFLHQVRHHLDLKNVEITQSRTEAYCPSSRFDVVVSRAFADLNAMCRTTRHLLSDGGAWFAMKSQTVDNEIAALEHHFSLERLIHLDVPLLTDARMLAIVKPTSPEA